jgi:hypothetical protein
MEILEYIKKISKDCPVMQEAMLSGYWAIFENSEAMGFSMSYGDGSDSSTLDALVDEYNYRATAVAPARNVLSYINMKNAEKSDLYTDDTEPDLDNVHTNDFDFNRIEHDSSRMQKLNRSVSGFDAPVSDGSHFKL